ncbi:putative acetyltransferase [compost metagenome]
MEILPLSQASLSEGLKACNPAFQASREPIDWSPMMLQRWMTLWDIPAETSILLRVDGKPAGLSLGALRGDRAWITTFGIHPDFRRRGLGRVLLAAQLDRLREAGARSVRLEVLAENVEARALYEAGGFQVRRALSSFEGTLPLAAPRSVDFDWSLALNPPAWPEGRDLAWQREPASSLNFAWEASWFGKGPDYVLYLPMPSGVRILDLSAAPGPGYRDRVLELWEELAGRFPGTPVRLLNEPDDSELFEVLQSLGCVLSEHYAEMAIAL